MLVVDERWTGAHGIGRFSREVISRLALEWSPLGKRISPSSPLDALNPRRLQLKTGDVLFTPGYNAGPSRARQILTLHDMIHLEVPSESNFKKRMYYERVVRPAIEHSGVVLTVSNVSKAAIEEWLSNDAVQVVNVGNGCSAAFSPIGEVSKQFDNYFIYVGNLKPHKNFDVLLSALAERPDYNLLVVSDDEELVKKKAAESNLHDRVFTVSGVSDEELASYYRGSLGLLFPSMLEGFGLPVAEAVNSGAQVAYWTGCSSVAEIMSGQGIAVQSLTSQNEWATAMDDLCAIRETESAVRSSKMQNRHRWDLVAERIQNVLVSSLKNDV
jgi:glycosyltransferase involved in cell wall biosynthesis